MLSVEVKCSSDCGPTRHRKSRADLDRGARFSARAMVIPPGADCHARRLRGVGPRRCAEADFLPFSLGNAPLWRSHRLGFAVFPRLVTV